jgi:hypothetical protein
VIARLAPLGLSLAALLLLAAPARAQEDPRPPPEPGQPAAPAPACTVVVVDGPCVVVQVPAQPPPAYPSQGPVPYYTVPQVPYYPPPLPPGADPPRRPSSVLSGKLFVGPSYQRIYDLAIIGADFGAAVGAQRGISGWYFELEGLAGRTEHGLSAYQVWLGGSWEAKISRVHLGLGLHVGWLGIARATATGGLVDGVGIGIFGFGSVDLYQADDNQALYLAGRVTGNWMASGESAAVPVYGPSATLGWRF